MQPQLGLLLFLCVPLSISIFLSLSLFSMRYLQSEMHKPLTPPTPAHGAELKLSRRSLDAATAKLLLPPRQLPALPGSASSAQAVDATPPTRNGALLGQCSTETLIEMLKQHAGLKDCSAETVQHINAVS